MRFHVHADFFHFYHIILFTGKWSEEENVKHWIAMQGTEIILLVILSSCGTCQGTDLGTCVYLVLYGG